MIAAMSKFELTALSSERAQLLRALQRTQLVELTFEGDGENAPAADASALAEKLARVKRSIEFLTAQADAAPDKKKIREALSDQIVLAFDDFVAVAEREETLMRVVSETEACADKLAACRAERNKLAARRNQVAPYAGVPEPLSAFAGTRSTQCFFGLLDEGALAALAAYVQEQPLAAYTVYEGAKQVPVAVFCHRSAEEATAEQLSGLAFARCPFRFAATAAEEIARLDGEADRLLAEEAEITRGALDRLVSLRDLKIFADYLSAELEKAERTSMPVEE